MEGFDTADFGFDSNVMQRQRAQFAVNLEADALRRHIAGEDLGSGSLEWLEQSMITRLEQQTEDAKTGKVYAGERGRDEFIVGCLRAQRIARQSNFPNHDPAMVMDLMINMLPEEAPRYPVGREPSLPSVRFSPLQSYMLSRLDRVPAAAVQLDEERFGALRGIDSFNCLRDEVRTKRFMRAVGASVIALDQVSEGPIEVLDAGTGSLPVLAIYAALKSDKVRCTALELNPRSAAIAKEVVIGFGLEDRIQIIEADATTYKPERQPDLLVSETMHSGLTQEPIVQILNNLAPFVRPEGIILPNQIDVQAALVPLDEYENASHVVRYDTRSYPVLNPDWEKVVSYTPGSSLETITFDTDMSNQATGEYLVVVSNTVHLGGSQPIEPSEALITAPQYSRDDFGKAVRVFDTADPKATSTITTSYPPGSLLNNVSKFTA